MYVHIVVVFSKTKKRRTVKPRFFFASIHFVSLKCFSHTDLHFFLNKNN